MKTRVQAAAHRLERSAVNAQQLVLGGMSVPDALEAWKRDQRERAGAQVVLSQALEVTLIPALEDHHRRVVRTMRVNTERARTRKPIRRDARTPARKGSREGHGRPRQANAPPSPEGDKSEPAAGDLAALLADLADFTVRLERRLGKQDREIAALVQRTEQARRIALDAMDIATDRRQS